MLGITPTSGHARFKPAIAMPAAVQPQMTQWIDSRSGPAYVEFTFHYRSQDQLREMGLVTMNTTVLGKQETSEYGDGKEKSTSKPRSFWSWWSKS